MDDDNKLRALAKRMKNELGKGAVPASEEVTVREFLSWFGYSRRGSHKVGRIRQMLTELELRTIPDFEVTWIDAPICIELDPEAVEGITASEKRIDPTVRIGAIEAANRRPVRVDPNSPLNVATTLMLTNDFSQLPVMQNERDVRGVISWKSIGTRLALRQDRQFVRECMDSSVPEISIEAPLFSAVEDISQHGYVLVRAEDNKITGIVTSSDIGYQFMQLAGPFLMIGEIEGYLRSLVHRKFTSSEMQETLPPSESGRPVASPEDLTLGGYCQLLGREAIWNRLGLNLDRREFVKQLDWVREKRNDVMHFDPDGLEPGDIERLENLVECFRNLRNMDVM